MYFLVLAALLQIDTLAPNFYGKFNSALDCEKAVKSYSAQYADELAKPENQAMGLMFVCMKLQTV